MTVAHLVDHQPSFLLATIHTIVEFVILPIFIVKSCCSLSHPEKRKSVLKNVVITIIIPLLLIAGYELFLTDDEGLHDLVHGTDPKLNLILERVPALQRGPTPPLFWRNRHMQFLPWLIQNEIHREGIPFQRVELQVTGCVDKSNPDCQPSSTMNDTITLDIFPPLQDVESEFNRNFNESSPVILYSPGLRCYSQDMPGNMIIRRAYGAGFRSIVINRRGHTPGQLLKSPRWNLFGDTEDMEQAYWHIKHSLVGPKTPFFLHGISSGTSVTVTALSKWDRRRQDHPDTPTPTFVASVAITPGYDISRVMQLDRFQFPYNHLFTPLVKDFFVRRNEAVLRRFDSAAVDRVLRAASLQDFVDRAAPFAGYANQTEYYRGENPVNRMHDITTPKFVLNSIDDPCCNIHNFYEISPYPQHGNKTFAHLVSETKRGMVAVAKTGSHCPFLDGRFFPFVRDPLFGGWMLNSWADQVSIELYQAALDVYSDRI